MAQKKGELNLTELRHHSRYIGKLQPLFVKQIWQRDSKNTDSVLWEMPLQTSTFWYQKYKKDEITSEDNKIYINTLSIATSTIKCKNLEGPLFIFEKIINDSIYIEVRKKDNEFLNEEIKTVYLKSELNKLQDEVNDHEIKIAKINLKFCENSNSIEYTLFVSLIPTSSNITYNNPALNEYFLAVYKNNANQLLIDNCLLYSYQTKISPFFSKENTCFKIKKFNDEKQGNKRWYSKSYYLGDTLNFIDTSFILDSISRDGKKIYVTYYKNSYNKTNTYLSTSSLNKINNYVKSNYDYIIIDFWATWCKPCIESFDNLKKINKKLTKNILLVSICLDQKKNYQNYLGITKRTTWKHVFSNIDLDNTLAMELNVKELPTYLILSRAGEVIYQDYGKDILPELESVIQKIKNR